MIYFSMKKIKILLFLIVVLSQLCSCGERRFGGYLFPIQENGLYGYIDSLGNHIIEPQFLWGSSFANGVAMVVVDTIYKEYMNSDMMEAGEVSEPLKEYRMFVKYGFINRSGEFVLPPNYLGYVIMPEYGYVEDNIDDCSSALYRYHFRNERAMFNDTTTWRCGYMDLKGKIVVKPTYYWSRRFRSGYAVVNKKVAEPLYIKDLCITPSKLRCAYIDRDGNEKTDFIFETLTDFEANRGIGMLKVLSDEMDGSYQVHNIVINEKGDYIDTLSFFYKYYGYTDDGICVGEQQLFVGLDNTHPSMEFFDKNGKSLQPLKGLSEAQLNILGKRKDIMQVFPEDLDFYDVTFFSDGLAGVTADGEHWFFMDRYKIIHGYGEESIYQAIKGFAYGLAAVKKKGKWGFVDNKIKEIIPCKYDSCGVVYPYLVEAFELNPDGSIKTQMYVNRNDSIVWKVQVAHKEDVKNKYTGKKKQYWHKWL